MASVGPVLAAGAVLGHVQPGHGEHGQPVVTDLGVGVRAGFGNQQAHPLAHLIEEVGDHDGVLVVLGGVAAQRLEHLPGCASGRPPTARTARSSTIRVWTIFETS